MNKLLEKFIPGGFALALLLLTGTGVASYLSIQKSIENKQLVEHTRQVLEALDKTLEGLNDAERGRRGYIITSKKSYLESYKTGIQIHKKAIQSLRKLTGDNPRQQARLDRLEPLITKILALLQKSVDLGLKKKLDMVTQIAITEEGRKIRKTLQAKLNLIDREERKLLKQRSEATERSITNTIFIGGIGYLFSLSLLCGVYFLLQRQIRISQLAEAELKSQAQILDLANETIIIYDLEDRIIYWNQGAERLYGWTKEEATGQPIHQLLQTGFLKPLTAIKDECLEQGYWDGELKHFKRDRTPITVASRWTLERDEEGKPVAILEINNDITKRDRAEKELRESEERWQLAVRGTTDGIWDLNIKTNQIYYSPRWKEMLGYAEDEISDRITEWIERIHAEDLERVMEVYHQHLLRKIPFYSAEHRLRCKDGNYKWILTRGLALWDEAGSPIRISGSHTDISDRKTAEIALQQSQEELKRVNEELEILVQERTVNLKQALVELQQNIRELQQTEAKLNAVNRALRVLSACNQALVRTKEESRLLQNICEIIVEMGNYRMAWVGYAKNDPEKTIKPVAKAGYEANYLQSIKIVWDDTEYGRGPTGSAIRTGQPYIAQNIATNQNYALWRDGLIQRGYHSSISLPLKDGESAFGALCIYAEEKNAFDPEEVNLLQELADNLSFGIMALNTESDRQKAEAALRQSERRYATLTETVPVGIFRTDLEGNNLYHNERWCEITRLSVEESQGQGWVKGLHPDDRDRVFNEWYRSLAENRPFLSEHRLQRPDGVITWVFVQSVAERDADGELIGFVGTLTDITERKRMEQALKDARDELEIRVQIRTQELTQANVSLEAEIIERREAEKKLEQLTTELKRSNHELEQFAYIASHDLQEPLRAVTGYTQLLAQEYQSNLDDSAREYVSYIVDGASRMRQLIQDLLAYSRVGTRAQEFALIDCNLVLRQAIANLQVAIAETNASIAFDSLPTVIADSTQLIQLFQNLIGNAIKFCDKKPPQIRIWAELKDGQWLFAVSDNGIGIKPQYLERIFEIFKRLHTRRAFPGTGIGLAICKKIVERHGGIIWAESQPGVGTTFYFTLMSAEGSRYS